MLEEVRKVMAEEGVTVIEADQCMFGLKTWGDKKSKLVPAKKKPTTFVSKTQK